MTDQELLHCAQEAFRNSYAPYSTAHVGAAILCADGTVCTGCNIENVSYGLTVCAERVAVYHAVAAGKRTFQKIAVASNQQREFSPCGACRQVLAEFSPKMEVIWQDGNGAIKKQTLDQLLPCVFKK